MSYPSRLSTGDGTSLIQSPQSKRLAEIMQDLIIAAYERSTKRRGKSLSLVRLQFAFDESNGAKSCTHYDALVKDHELNETIPLCLSIAVSNANNEDTYWDR